jgi:hypothetical protein
MLPHRLLLRPRITRRRVPGRDTRLWRDRTIRLERATNTGRVTGPVRRVRTLYGWGRAIPGTDFTPDTGASSLR